jgi:glycine cleavage system aminomethyltransferase T
VTVTRLAEDRFRVVTGAGAVDSDRGFLELHGARVEDVTDDYAVIGIWGPEARAALVAITDEDVSSEAFPFGTAKGLGSMLAQRITYVGELGYEIYVPRADALAVWDALFEAASPEPVGYAALDSLRIEKGYRYFGTDMTSLETPFEAGIGFCVAKGKWPLLDRAAAAHSAHRRIGLRRRVRRRGGVSRQRGCRPYSERGVRLHGAAERRAGKAAYAARGGRPPGGGRTRRARSCTGRTRRPLRPEGRAGQDMTSSGLS